MAENQEAIDRLIERADELADTFERIARSGGGLDGGAGGGGGGGGGVAGGARRGGRRGLAGGFAGALGIPGTGLAGAALSPVAFAVNAVANQAKKAAKTAAFRFADSAFRFGFGPGGISAGEAGGDALSAAAASIPILGIGAEKKRSAIDAGFSRVAAITGAARRAGRAVTDQDRAYLASIFVPQEIRAGQEAEDTELFKRRIQGRVSTYSQGEAGDQSEFRGALLSVAGDIRQMNARGYPSGPRSARMLYGRSQ